MKLLHKNSLSGVAQLSLTAALTFFSIPLFIRTLGAEAYGTFSIVTLAGNLNIFANLGLNTALLRFLSLQGKSKESDYDIAVTVGLLLVIMVPLSVLAITFQTSILQGLLGLSDELYAQVTTLYRYVVIANLVILLGQTFTTILDSQQRIYLTNFYQFLYSLLYWGGLIAVVSLGYGLAEVGMTILGAAVIWFVVVTTAAWRLWGRLQLHGLGSKITRVAGKQLSYGVNVYTAGLLTMLFEPMTKVLVSRLIGVTEVGYLEIAYKIRSQLWAVVMKVTYPLFPKIAVETNLIRLNRLITNYQTGMLLVIIPLLLFVSLTLPDLITLWLPTANSVVTTAALCITVTFIINSLSIPPYYFLTSREHVGKTVWIQFANVSVSLLVGLLTYKTMGIYGFVLGNSMAILFSLFLCLYYQQLYMERWRVDMPQLRSLLVIIVPVGILAVSVSFWVHRTWLRIGIISCLIAFGYLTFLYRSYKTLRTLSL